MKAVACTLFALLFAVAYASPVAQMREGKTVRSFLHGGYAALHDRVEALQKRQIASGWTVPPFPSVELPALPASNPVVPKLVRFFGAQDLQASLRKRLAEIEATQQKLIEYFKQLREHQFLKPPCDDVTTTTSTTASMSSESTSTSTTSAPKKEVVTESAEFIPSETVVPSTSEETVSSSTAAAEEMVVSSSSVKPVEVEIRNNNVEEVAVTSTEAAVTTTAEQAAVTEKMGEEMHMHPTTVEPMETSTEVVEEMSTEEVATTQTSA
ncbi:hypothetical protein TKK_0019463 [Trichogramma kaykai]